MGSHWFPQLPSLCPNKNNFWCDRSNLYLKLDILLSSPPSLSLASFQCQDHEEKTFKSTEFLLKTPFSNGLRGQAALSAGSFGKLQAILLSVARNAVVQSLLNNAVCKKQSSDDST